MKNNAKQIREQVLKTLDAETIKFLDKISQKDTVDNEYKEMLDYLQHLETMRKELLDSKTFKIDWKIWAPVIGSLASIVLIMNYEKADVLATKALGFIPKGRV